MILNIVRGLHILAVIAWMSGLLYLPRLFVYHTRSAVGSESEATFKTMEAKLAGIIMTPAMLAVLLLGGGLVALEGAAILLTPWMATKLTGVVFLVGWHAYLLAARRRLARGHRDRTERFWRMTNELPFLAAVVIVLSVATKFGA